MREVDSHTEGEPTRVVNTGWPQPRGWTMAEPRDDLGELMRFTQAVQDAMPAAGDPFRIGIAPDTLALA